MPSNNLISSDLFIQSWLSLAGLKLDDAVRLGDMRSNSIQMNRCTVCDGRLSESFMPADFGWDLGMDLK